VFLDTETTSLDAVTGEIWEVGMVSRYPDGTETENAWALPVTLEHADPIALSIGRFHERHPQGNETESLDWHDTCSLDRFVSYFAELTHGAHLVGNVISFDEERLRGLLRAHGVMPSWHYHLVDVEAMAAGKLGIDPPWDSADLCAALGVDMPTEWERHTALGDAKWAMRMYDAVIGR
jgi:hypothetical protein